MLDWVSGMVQIIKIGDYIFYCLFDKLKLVVKVEVLGLFVYEFVMLLFQDKGGVDLLDVRKVEELFNVILIFERKEKGLVGIVVELECGMWVFVGNFVVCGVDKVDIWFVDVL